MYIPVKPAQKKKKNPKVSYEGILNLFNFKKEKTVFLEDVHIGPRPSNCFCAYNSFFMNNFHWIRLGVRQNGKKNFFGKFWKNYKKKNHTHARFFCFFLFWAACVQFRTTNNTHDRQFTLSYFTENRKG